MTYTRIIGSPVNTHGPNGTITRVVLHATVSPCEPGGARNVAAYFQTPSAGGLAHFIVDPGEVIQSCDEATLAFHAPPNAGSIGVELCDPQTGAAERWDDLAHTRMLSLAAQLVADICHRHNVPVQYVDRSGLLAGQHGVTTHFEVAQAWHQSDHTDPGGGFPITRFLGLVRAAAHPQPTEDIVTPEDRKAIVRDVVAALAPMIATHDDIRVVINGTADGSHPYNLKSILNAVNDMGVLKP